MRIFNIFLALIYLITMSASADFPGPYSIISDNKFGKILKIDTRGFAIDRTIMFREDINWKYFINYIKKRFDNEDKINTYIYGCSDGSEAYTMSILFQENFQNPEKFYPIIVKDINEALIKKINSAKKYNMALSLEAQNIKQNTPFNKRIQEALNLSDKETSKYFEIIGDNILIKEKVRKPIKFQYIDAIKDINSIDSKKPSIVMARIIWLFINKNEYQDYANKLYKKLAPKSIVVLGGFDFSTKSGYVSPAFAIALEKAGFTPSEYPIGNYSEARNLIFEKN